MNSATTSDIAGRRLLHQHIAGERFTAPGEVVRWMGAMQAQDYQQALWAIGVRMHSPTVARVEAAIASGEIILTWLMRGTLHVALAENVKWMLELVASHRLAADGARMRQLGLDRDIVERCRSIFYDALHGGRHLTRSEMMRLLADANISPAGQRGYHILWHAAQSGLICLGPMRGKEQTFALLDEWAPATRRRDRAEALAELAACYFASRGPATVADFAGWAGLTLTDARAGWEAARAQLVATQHAGGEYWATPDLPRSAPPGVSDVYLLPGFDEYLLGYKQRGDVLAAEHAHKVAPGGNGVFFPIIVAGGRVVGTWKRAVKRNALNITLHPFAELGISHEHLTSAALRYSAFLGLPLSSVTEHAS